MSIPTPGTWAGPRLRTGTRDLGYPIISESIEPTAAYIIGRMWARCEAVKDHPAALEGACIRFWWAVRALNDIAIAVETATHFSITAGNAMHHAADYIKERIGVDPMSDKDPRFSRSEF